MQEYEKMRKPAFPGNGSPKVNKDHEIIKLRKKAEELECEILKVSKPEYYDYIKRRKSNA